MSKKRYGNGNAYKMGYRLGTCPNCGRVMSGRLNDSGHAQMIPHGTRSTPCDGAKHRRCE